MTSTNDIKNYRRFAESARRLTINPAPTSRPTYRANQASYAIKMVAMYEAAILGSDPHLAGLMKDERDLLDRIYEARVEKVARPELKARLKVTRREIEEVK